MSNPTAYGNVVKFFKWDLIKRSVQWVVGRRRSRRRFSTSVDQKRKVTHYLSNIRKCTTQCSPHSRQSTPSPSVREQSQRIFEKFQNRIPVICEKAEKSDIPEIDKRKYLVPSDLTVGQFVYVIRKRIMLPPEKAIFIFVNDTLPPTAALMSAVYQDHKDKDGFLYVTYSGENTFGSFR